MGFVRNHGPPYASSEKLCCTIVTTFTMPMLHVSVDMQNRINNSGIPYDPAGNTTSDGTQTYTWNAENRLTAGGGVTYTYDGDGRRVKKSNGKLYWYGVSGEGLTETDLSGNNPTDYIFFSGQRIARRDPSGTVHYFFRDHLGSMRAITNASGGVVRDVDYNPWGWEPCNSGSADDSHRFADMLMDNETVLYHTLFRQYSPTLGRWLSTDPEGCGVESPQGLNLYPYVTDNPTNLVDLLGLQGCPPWNPFAPGCEDRNPADRCSEYFYFITHAECGSSDHPVRDIIRDEYGWDVRNRGGLAAFPCPPNYSACFQRLKDCVRDQIEYILVPCLAYCVNYISDRLVRKCVKRCAAV
jgi:RHS repeat-associated protein